MKLAFEFNNRFFNELPQDKEEQNHPRQVYNACYSKVLPTRVRAPKTIAVSQELAEQLGIDFKATVSSEFAEVFSGNRLVEGMQPFAMCYGGHQFGNWAGQLGDGRAINLGEVIDKNGDNQTLQLKGAGLTPYSRTADGLAVLRSSVREFLCSEAMFHLGVPTTRALSLVLSGEQVMRDMFYDGNPAYEPGAIVCRVSPSFIRFGNFQIFTARKDTDNLKRLIAFCIRYDFPHLIENKNLDEWDEQENIVLDQEIVEQWFDEVCQRTAKLVVEWMRVGFVHGVMNTDNMSILGLTIDYGPYGWLENYDPNWTPNTTDAQGRRYCFGNQPQVAHWNLYQLANAIAPVLDRTEALEASLDKYADEYNQQSMNMYARKLGFNHFDKEINQSLIQELFELLQSTEIDMTIFFRNLGNISTTESYHDVTLFEKVRDAYYLEDALSSELITRHTHWLRGYLKTLSDMQVEPEDRKPLMSRMNPKYVLRNYLAQVAIDKATAGDYSEIARLQKMIKNPYDEQPEFEEYFAKRPDWARHKAGCSMLSCSS